MTEIGLVKVSVKELDEIKARDKPNRKQIVFVNRRPYFQPPEDTVRRFNDFMRRYQAHDTRKHRIALEGSHYDSMYRRKIMNSGESLSKLRGIARRSQERTIYMVEEETDRPDVDILIEIATYMIGQDVWRK